MRLIVFINAYLQDARWEEQAKTEACFAGINIVEASQKLDVKRVVPLSQRRFCIQSVRISSDKNS